MATTKNSASSGLNENFTRRFEYPQPKAVADIASINQNCGKSMTLTGTFTISNAGQGLLTCTIFSDSHRISFIPENWSGDIQRVEYTISTDELQPQDVLSAMIYIHSNGGEVRIPVTINIMPHSIVADDGTEVTTLQGFANLVRTSPKSAKQLFLSRLFADWLIRIDRKIAMMYNNFCMDTNKDRALDNFLVAYGLKEPTVLEVPNRRIMAELMPMSSEKYVGSILVKKSSPGYIECNVDTRFDRDWLSIPKHRLAASDFDSDGVARIPFNVDPLRISNSVVSNVVEIVSDLSISEVEISARRKPLVEISLSQESYKFEDKGTLQIINNTGAELPVELSVTENFIKFDAKRYFISARSEIPFTIKMSALYTSGIAGLFQKPFAQGQIIVKALVGKDFIKKVLTVNLGNIL